MDVNDAKKIISILKKAYPNARYYLNFSNPLQLLVSAILSAQVRDEAVNTATSKLFKEYRTVDDFAAANIDELTRMISNITFASNKAKHIKEACKQLAERYDGKVPKTADELTKLQGVGKKTANAILQNAFDIVEGIVVDTHVLRVSYRLGWSATPRDAKKTEKELMKIIPKEEWKKLPWLLKAHGRAICKAPRPICTKCPVNTLCPKKGVEQRF